MRRSIVIAAAVCALAAGAAHGATQAFTGARILPISGPAIENGVFVIEDGAIAAIGAAGEVDVPDGAEVTDLSGKVIMPGLVDTHSHLGGPEGGDRSDALHPGVRAMDAVNVRSDQFRKAWAGGITTMNVMPGSGHLMSGQTVYLKLRTEPRTINDWLFCDDPVRGVCGGMKMANGTNSIREEKAFPDTRAMSAKRVRELFQGALAYRGKKESAGRDESKRPPVDLGKEALLQILDGERQVHFHTHRHDDVMTALRIADEFGFTPVLHHVSEAWRVADEIAAAGAPASIIMVDSPGGKLEAVNLLWKNAPALEEAGALTAFHTDDWVTDSRLFLRSAGFGVRAGMSRDKALEAMTLAGAKMLDLDDRLGSLEPGKDADFIVLSGDPLSVYTHVEQTWVEGARVFDRSDPEQKLWATGGPGVFRGDTAHAHDHGGAR